VKKAQMAAINNIRPGIKGAVLDGFARRIIADEGYGAYFQHGLGHGLGLSPHEKPSISFRLEDSIVPEDCVVAIEPGVYFVDKYGIRIEDNVLVTRTGPIMLTQSPDTLISIG
jgi:Xaa-Pro aminopeptidase